jgi:DNA-binding NarL/FixJ family response regulator
VPATLSVVKVLVVDDSAAVRGRLVALLREAGLDVVGEAGTAGQALELTRALAPDGIVLDLKLPDRSGLEIMVELKQLAPAAVVVVLTNDPSDGHRRLSVARGADCFLDKSSAFDLVAPALAKRWNSSPT